ncbi:MAG: aldo/keto reductase [Acidimicrobiales bacterium]
MRYKLLGPTGLRVSEVCLGTMTFGPDWGWGADRDVSKAMFDAFAEAGGNFIDTANRYTNGTSETYVGEFTKADRGHFVVSTKYTLTRDGSDPNAGGNHRKSLVESLDASLRRLGTDYIDVYWVHIWDPLTPIEETMRALDDQIRAGKILYLGISDAPAWVVARANAVAEARGWTPFAALQSQYSLAERNAERELLPISRNLDIAFTAWGALATGLLTGKYNDDPTGGGGRIHAANWGTLEERKLAIAREVVTVAKEIGCSPSQVALRWVSQQSPTMIPLIGCRKLSQLVDNVGAVDITLDAEHVERLDQVSAIELGFPYDFIKGGRRSWLGDVVDQVDDHRNTVVC